MIALLAATFIEFDFSPRPVTEQLARHCAAAVGIPYASDNFTDKEWESFKRCILTHQ